MAESLRLMLEQDVERIVLSCGTAHYFLTDVYKEVPEAKERVVDIVDVLGENLEKRNVRDVLVIAAEGTLKQGLYSKCLKKDDVTCVEPDVMHYKEIRFYIECVKIE